MQEKETVCVPAAPVLEGEASPAHTPTPWRFDLIRFVHGAPVAGFVIHRDPKDDARAIAGCNYAEPDARFREPEEIEANAARIVRCVNSHEALVEALTALVDEFGESIRLFHKLGPDYTHSDGAQTIHASTLLDREQLIEQARAALSLATE